MAPPPFYTGQLHVVDLTSGPSTDDDQIAFVQTAEASTKTPIDFVPLQWPNLSLLEQQEARGLLEKYQGVYISTHVLWN